MKFVNGWWLPEAETHLLQFIEAAGSYQKGARDEMFKRVSQFRVAVDVGAHVGLWARDMGQKFGHVHCFEPVPEHRDCLVKNVDMGNVTLHPVALGASEGLVKMAIEPDNTGGTHIDPDAEGDVPLKTLDSFGLEDVDFIKIDCESYEVKVVEGAKETLLRCRPIVCIEQKPHKWFGHHRYAAARLLENMGATFLGGVRDDLCFGW